MTARNVVKRVDDMIRTETLMGDDVDHSWYRNEAERLSLKVIKAQATLRKAQQELAAFEDCLDFAQELRDNSWDNWSKALSEGTDA